MGGRKIRVSVPIGKDRWKLLRQLAPQVRMSMAQLMDSLIDWGKFDQLQTAANAERDDAI